MLELLLIVITLGSGFLVVYHHVGYPLALRFFIKKQKPDKIINPPRQYHACRNDHKLPLVTLVIPAFNEQRWIDQKIRNTAVLDYPPAKLHVIVACDGCTDDTVNIAKQVALEPECRHLAIEVRTFQHNRGKVAVINDVIESTSSELIALSDVSALISVDALLIAAEHFKRPDIGVLNSHYRLLNPGSVGEKTYWDYQCQLKADEAALGSTLGAHGAFYLFRRKLFQQLAVDTINDDFILPMEIVAKGYRASYETRINALELECANGAADQQRRRRIAAGNLQQLLRLKRLLLPRYRGLAFAFASGKALRVLIPLLLINTFMGSIILAFNYEVFALLLLIQILIYALLSWHVLINPLSNHPFLHALSYLIKGHVANLIGSVRYLIGLEAGHWKRITPNNNRSLSHE